MQKKWRLAIGGAIFFIQSILLAAEFLDPAEITSDTAQTANRRVVGTVLNTNFIGVTLTTERGRITVPHNVMVAIYFAGADNAAYIEGLQQLAKRKYNAALTAFNTAEKSVAKMEFPQRDFFMEELDYQRGITGYYAHDFVTAENYLTRAAQRNDAVYKFESEYLLARNWENGGNYEKAAQKYQQLIYALFPRLLESNPPDGARWLQLAQLGSRRVEVFLACSRPNNEAQVTAALTAFRALTTDDDPDLRFTALHVELKALRYFAEKDSELCSQIIKRLDTPLLAATMDNDHYDLGWMYLYRADANYDRALADVNSMQRHEYLENALYDYMRVAYGYWAIPINLARAYFRIGKCLEILQGTDWRARALLHYRNATSSIFRATPTYEAAQTAISVLEKSTSKNSH